MKSLGYLFIFLVLLRSSIFGSAIFIPEGLPFHEEAKTCYVSLKLQSNLGQLSRSVTEFADAKINDLASDSTDARSASLICLRKFLKTEEDRESLISGFNASLAREDKLSELEKKILFNPSREYPLTPMEEKSSRDWFAIRESLVEDLRKLTREGILYTEEEWQKKNPNWREEVRARYGALLREREKLLFSLTIESKASYLNFLTKFTEK